MLAEIVRNPEKGCAVLRLTNADATPSELRLREMRCVFPGLPKRNPGLELANAFSVMHFLTSQKWAAFQLFVQSPARSHPLAIKAEEAAVEAFQSPAATKVPSVRLSSGWHLQHHLGSLFGLGSAVVISLLRLAVAKPSADLRLPRHGGGLVRDHLLRGGA